MKDRVSRRVNFADGSLLLLSVQTLYEPAVLDLLQDPRIDQIAGLEFFNLRAAFAELIQDSLNSLWARVRNAANQPLGHLLVGGLHERDIVDAGVFFQHV